MTTLAKRDNPLSTIEQTSGSKTSAKKILIAVDESDQSVRAVQYVGSLLRETQDVSVTLFHVLNPMPRELMEHGARRIRRLRTILANSCVKSRRSGCGRKAPLNTRSW